MKKPFGDDEGEEELGKDGEGSVKQAVASPKQANGVAEANSSSASNAASEATKKPAVRSYSAHPNLLRAAPQQSEHASRAHGVERHLLSCLQQLREHRLGIGLRLLRVLKNAGRA